MNGVAVWHEPFAKKIVPWINYFSDRNMLILNFYAENCNSLMFFISAIGRLIRWSAEFAYILVRHFKALARLVILLTVEADVIVLRHLNVLRGAFVVAVADVVRSAVFAFSAGHLLSSFPQRGSSFFTFSL